MNHVRLSISTVSIALLVAACSSEDATNSEQAGAANSSGGLAGVAGVTNAGGAAPLGGATNGGSAGAPRGGSAGTPGAGGTGMGGTGMGGTGMGGTGMGGIGMGGIGMGGIGVGGAGVLGGAPPVGGAPPAGGGPGAGGDPAAGGDPGLGGGPGAGGDPAAGGDPGLVGGGPGAGGDSGAAGQGTAGDPGVGGQGAGGAPPDALTVQLQEVRQIIRGFGVNATIMDTSKSMPWDKLFGLEGPDALGLSILRIGMDENGGHRSVPSSWTTARDTYHARVIGSCWSAPGDWKDNGKTTAGGHLLPDRYDDWATMIADYADSNGLYAMGIGNETDFASCATNPTGSEKACSAPLTDQYESMVYTGKELADFAAVAGPIFDERAPNTLMMAPEASIWLHVWSNLSPTNKANGGYDSSDPLGCGCFSNDIDDTAAEANCNSKCTDEGKGGYDYGHRLWENQDAWNGVDIIGLHEYESQKAYKWPADVNGGVRDKEVWQTEMSGVMHWPEQGPSTDINNGVAVGRWIHSALTVGEASAWLYWWYEAYYQNDNEGLGLTKGGNTLAKRYYVMGNFSRFIRPDVFHAVQVAGPSPADVMVSAYKGDNDEVIIVAINESGQAVDVPILITGGTVPASMATHVTSDSQNLVAGDSVQVADGVLAASLPGKSVTTFVSE